MNAITAIKIAGLADAAKTVAGGIGKVFQGSAHIGGEAGKMLGSETAGRLVGYAAPVLAANAVANQYGPSRRAKAWVGQQLGTGGQVVGRALTPNDFGMRPGDMPGGYY